MMFSMPKIEIMWPKKTFLFQDKMDEGETIKALLRLLTVAAGLSPDTSAVLLNTL